MFKKYKNIFITILLILLVVVLDFLYCNYKTINHLNTKSIFNETKLIENDLYKEYSVSLNNEYIKKLYINYESNDEKEIRYSINGISNADELTKYINLEVLNINNKVNTINLQVDKDVNINDIKVVNKLTFNTSILLTMIVLIITIMFIIETKSELKKNLHKLFLILFVGFGSTMILSGISVNGYSWDDQIHFDRTIETIYFKKYKTSDAETGNANIDYKFPYYNTKEEQKEIEKYLNKVDKRRYSKKRTSSIDFTSLSYLPGSLIYNFMKVCNIDFSLRFKLTKEIMLILYGIVIAFAIKIATKYKLLLFAIGLLPINVFIASNFNYDTFILAFVLLGMAEFIKMMSDKKINKKDYIIFLLSMSLGVLNKAVYVPLIMLSLLIPKDKFKDSKESKKYKTITIIVCILVLLSFIAPTVFAPPSGGDARLHENVSVSGQISYIIHNPIKFTIIFIKNAGYLFFDKFFGVGSILNYGYIGVPSGNYLYYLVLITLILSYLKACDDGSILNKNNKIILSILLFIIIGFIWGALYLSFNDVGAYIIDGVQGRYFIPLLLPLFMVIITDNIKCKLDDNKLIIGVTIILLVVYIISLLGLFIPFSI